jgi:hypothetical protein
MKQLTILDYMIGLNPEDNYPHISELPKLSIEQIDDFCKIRHKNNNLYNKLKLYSYYEYYNELDKYDNKTLLKSYIIPTRINKIKLIKYFESRNIYTKDIYYNEYENALKCNYIKVIKYLENGPIDYNSLSNYLYHIVIYTLYKNDNIKLKLLRHLNLNGNHLKNNCFIQKLHSAFFSKKLFNTAIQRNVSVKILKYLYSMGANIHYGNPYQLAKRYGFKSFHYYDLDPQENAETLKTLHFLKCLYIKDKLKYKCVYM